MSSLFFLKSDKHEVKMSDFFFLNTVPIEITVLKQASGPLLFLAAQVSSRLKEASIHFRLHPNDLNSDNRIEILDD